MKNTRKWGICFLVAALLLQSVAACGLEKRATAAANKTIKNNASLKLKKGKKLRIIFRKAKGKAQWKSSDKTVATVRSKGKYGLIKAKKKGKVIITARVGKKTFRCKLRVIGKGGGQEDGNQGNSSGTGTEASESGSGNEGTSGDNQGASGGNQGTGGGNQGTNGGSQGTNDGNQGASGGNQGSGDVEQGTPQEDFDAATVNSSDYSRYFSLHAIHHSTATYYDNGYTNTCCNFDDIASGYDVCAINEYDYNTGVMAGAYLEVTGPKGKVNVLVTDLMPYVGNEPNCTRGALDLNENTFAKIADKIDGKVQISWKVIAFPTDGAIQYMFKEGSSQWWCEVQVRNHRYPIVKCEVKNADGSYTELPRQEYNYFQAEKGLGQGPYTFRVTDIYGRVLEDEVPLSPGQIVNGKANFPIM